MNTDPIQAPTYCNYCRRESHVGASCQTLPLPPLCLTLQPPWPQAFLYARKRLENRSAGVAAQIGGYRGLVGLTQSKGYSSMYGLQDALYAAVDVMRDFGVVLGTSADWLSTAGKLFIVADLIRIDRPHEARGNPWHVEVQHGLIFGKVWEVEPITATGAQGAWRPAKWCSKCGHILAAGARGAPKAACEHVWIESFPRPELRVVREVLP